MARLPPLNPTPLLRYSRLDRRLIEPQLGDEIAPNVLAKKGKKGTDAIKTCCAVYRQCVYWFNSEVERKIFTANPIAAIRAAGEQAKTLRHQPLQISIIGGPTSERASSECLIIFLTNSFMGFFVYSVLSSVSKQLVKDLHVAHITTTMAVQWLVHSVCHSWSSLVRKIHSVIMSGAAVPDSLVIQALKVALLSPQIQARGCVKFPKLTTTADSSFRRLIMFSIKIYSG